MNEISGKVPFWLKSAIAFLSIAMVIQIYPLAIASGSVPGCAGYTKLSARLLLWVCRSLVNREVAIDVRIRNRLC